MGAIASLSMGANRPGAGGSAAANPFPTPVLAVEGGPSGADKFKGAARLKDAFAIELDRLIPDPHQPRKEFDQDELLRLATSLETRGQLQPIRVRFDESEGKWKIISGERRYHAAVLAGLATLICVEAKGTPSPEDILEDQLVENCVREDLKPIEQARAFKALLEKRGCSYRQLAETLTISHQAVVRALALLDLPSDIQEKVASGAVPASTAAEVARVDNIDEQRALIAEIESSGMTRDQVSKVVKTKVAQAKGKGGSAKANSKANRKVEQAEILPKVDPSTVPANRIMRDSYFCDNGITVSFDVKERHTMLDLIEAVEEVLAVLQLMKQEMAA